MTYEQHFLWSLIATLAIEVPVAFVLIRHVYRKSKNADVIFAGIIASSLTLPYLWFVLPSFIPSRTAYICIGESAIVLIEAFVYYKILKISAKQAFVVSLMANIASVLFGIILNQFGVL